MIHNIESDLKSFKNLSFNPGLNIVLSEQSEGAANSQSRNGAGKTSFIELVHFLTGSRVGAYSLFFTNELRAKEFKISLDIGGKKVKISRCAIDPQFVTIDGDSKHLQSILKSENSLKKVKLTNEKLKEILGNYWFGLDFQETTKGIFKLSYRALISYFVRKQNGGGFLSPMQYFSRQPSWNQQALLSYLLGLDWRLPINFELLREKEAKVDQQVQVVESSEFGHFLGKTDELRDLLSQVQIKQQKLEDALDKFEIPPEYKGLEQEASNLTKQIDILNSKNLLDRNLVREMTEALFKGSNTEFEEFSGVYKEAKVVFPELVKKRFKEVQNFREAIIKNRKTHLGGELSTAKLRIKEREEKLRVLESRRNNIMSVLNSGNALDHFKNLQLESAQLISECERLSGQLNLVEEIKNRKREIILKRANLAKSVTEDLSEREESIQKIIKLFESYSGALYDRAGRFGIFDTFNGPKFDITDEAMRSKGIFNMHIFCFDMMLMELNVKSHRNPGFLIHDSHIFDGVDERQVAMAIQIGAKKSEELGFQYIITMNSDMLLRKLFPNKFNVNQYIVEPTLTDSNTGGLFGIRF